MRVFGLVGTSGSGKTTLLEKLIAEIAGRGLRVNAIKHSHHDIELEPPDKDSARFRAAGAGEVMVVSPYRYAIVHELRDEAEPDLAAQLARLAPADLTLLEGFRSSPFPKLEVWREANGKPPRFFCSLTTSSCWPPKTPRRCRRLFHNSGWSRSAPSLISFCSTPSTILSKAAPQR